MASHQLRNTKLNGALSNAVGTVADYAKTADRIGSRHQSYQVGRLVAQDVFRNSLDDYDRNTAADNADTMKVPTPGVDYAQKQAAARKDSGTLASTVGIKGYKKGGKVKKTGVYRLHKGERVLNPKQTKKFEKKGGLTALGGKKK